MDANLFYAFCLLFYVAFILANVIRTDSEPVKIALPVFVGILGMILSSTVSTDGGLTNPTSPTWPALYVPIFAILLNFLTGIINGAKAIGVRL